MERSLPSLLFVGQQIKEWIGILTKEVGTNNVMADVDMKLPDYNMAVYCLSAALAFTATIVFVMAWKRSDASKRNDEDCQKPTNDDLEGSDITNDLAWFRDRNVGGGESVPWILQEGPPGDDPIPPNDQDFQSATSLDSSEVDFFERTFDNGRKTINKMNVSGGKWYSQNIEDAMKVNEYTVNNGTGTGCEVSYFDTFLFVCLIGNDMAR